MNNNSNSNSATIVTTVESDLQSLLDPTDINLANLASDVSSNQTTSGKPKIIVKVQYCGA